MGSVKDLEVLQKAFRNQIKESQRYEQRNGKTICPNYPKSDN
jgi:hypothetical protein